MEIILMPPGGIIKLAKEFKTSRQAVSNALRNKTKSNFAHALRQAALDPRRGGRKFTAQETQSVKQI